MSHSLQSFLKGYASFKDGELADVSGRFEFKTVSKNDYLLLENKVCKDLIFVEKGCLRLYYISNNVEISVWFAFDNSSAIDIHSFISDKPSIYYLQAIEDSKIWVLSKTVLLKLYKTHPVMQEMMRNFWEDACINLIERFTALQKDSADKRYLDLLSKPPYLQKIPQKYLASFIGVTPTSLSRIRRKIR